MSRQCEMMQKEKDDLQRALSDREKEISSLLRLGEGRRASYVYVTCITCLSIHILYMCPVYGAYRCATNHAANTCMYMAVYIHAKIHTYYSTQVFRLVPYIRIMKGMYIRTRIHTYMYTYKWFSGQYRESYYRHWNVHAHNKWFPGKLL